MLHPKRCRIASGLLLGPKRAQAERSLTGRPVKRKLASGPKPNYRRGRAFVLQSLAADLHRERLAAYDELVAGRDVYTYVGNDPLDRTDPSGLAGCADASGQGLSGQCIQSSNFKESKSSGKTAVNTPAVDKAMVAAAPSIQTTSKDNPAEKAVAVTQNADGTTTTTSLKTETKVVGNTYESKVSGIPKSATGIEHSHPNDTSNLTPGPKDNAVVSSLGKTNGITNNGNVGVLEQSGGQYRFRVLQGSVGDAGEVQGVLNQFQRQDQ